MGHLLQAGDSVLGYDLSRAIIDDEILERIAFQQDVILVKKIYPDKLKVASKKQKRRNRRGKAKQDKPTATTNEVEESDTISPSAPSDGADIEVESSPDHPSLEVIPSKKIVKTSVFGWTGGDDEEYQEFHRKLALEDHEEDEVEESTEKVVSALDNDVDDDADKGHEQSDDLVTA
jgi:hypothetical protein